MTTTDPESPTPPSAKARFGRAFWVLNSIEMWERLAFFNLRVMAPIYIMQADNPGGLHLTAANKGTIYAWWAVFQSFLPIVTGGLADRFGFKRTLAFAISLMMIGYLMIAFMRDVRGVGNYWSFLFAILVLATGTAFFKPGIQGSLANQLTKANSSVGWGIFYWVVNVGAFIGHFLPSLFLLKGWFGTEANSPAAWRNLFLASAVFTSFNLLLLLTFKDVPSGASKTESLRHVLWRTLTNIVEPRLLSFIAIMSCFWLMMYQLWDLQPNFIADWVNSAPMAARVDRTLSALAAWWSGNLGETAWLARKGHSILLGLQGVFVEKTTRGPMIPQQVILSFNAFFIILGVVGAAWLTRRMRTLSAMLIGMCVATVGVIVAGWTQSAGVLIAGIFCFSLGEMMTGPKKSEYLGLIAPPGKKGLYLGYVNIPVGIGVFLGSWIAGMVYGRFGEKATLALRYLAEKTPLGLDKAWDGDVLKLETVLGVKRTAAMAKLEEVTGLDPMAATQMLWDTYHPHYIWIPFACIGVLAAVALWIFGRMARRWSDMNA